MILRAFAVAAFATVTLSATGTAGAHDIYTNLRGKDRALCCGGDDCAATVYKLERGHWWFMTKDDGQRGDAPPSAAHWVDIPQDRITFLPIPGDADNGDELHHAHLCYRLAMPSDYLNALALANVFGNIYLYCAFIPPGAIAFHPEEGGRLWH